MVKFALRVVVMLFCAVNGGAMAGVTYTWNSDVASGYWTEPSNWTSSGGTAYPSSGDVAAFAAGSTAEVTLTNKISIYQISVGKGADVTVRTEDGVSTNDAKFTVSSFNCASARLAFDRVALSQLGKTVLSERMSLSLANGASLYCSQIVVMSGQTVEVADGSFMQLVYYDVGACTTIVDNATLLVTGGVGTFSGNHGSGFNSYGTNAVYRLKGKSPLFMVSDSGDNNAPWFVSDVPNSTINVGVANIMEFEIPSGGFADAPFQASNAKKVYLRPLGGAWNQSATGPFSVGKSYMSVRVLESSPALQRGQPSLRDMPLIRWTTGGIYTNFVDEAAFVMPDAWRGNRFSWGDWVDCTWTSEGFATLPRTLSVTIAGRRGMTVILR